MRLYQTSGEIQGKPTDKILVRWSGTQVDARADRKELKEKDAGFIETEEIDVPTDKAGLLKFLNDNEFFVGTQP